MSRILVTWHASIDARTCPICKDLNGYTWIFEAGTGEFDSYLTHPKHGMVWYIFQGSKAHGHERFNCRCSMSVDYDLEDILAKCVFLRETIVQSENIIPWKGGGLFSLEK